MTTGDRRGTRTPRRWTKNRPWTGTPRPPPRRAAPSPRLPRPLRPGSPAAAPASPTPPAPRPERPGADQDTSDDAWARAVEQSPGIWTVGTDSNLGRYTTPDVGARCARARAGACALRAGGGTDPGVRRRRVRAVRTDLGPPGPGRSGSGAGALPQSVAPRRGRRCRSCRRGGCRGHAVPEPAATAGRQSLYQRLSNSPEAEAGRAKAPARAAAATTVYVQDIPSADDETIEESGVFGRAAVERILGGKLVEERSLDGSPLPPRF